MKAPLPDGPAQGDPRELAGVPGPFRRPRSKPEIALDEIDRLMVAGVRLGAVTYAPNFLIAPTLNPILVLPKLPESEEAALTQIRGRKSFRLFHHGPGRN